MPTLNLGLLSFNTQPPKGGWVARNHSLLILDVSTHSRLKAAGTLSGFPLYLPFSFNTQPPKGGWSAAKENSFAICSFQHTAA